MAPASRKRRRPRGPAASALRAATRRRESSRATAGGLRRPAATRSRHRRCLGDAGERTRARARGVERRSRACRRKGAARSMRRLEVRRWPWRSLARLPGAAALKKRTREEAAPRPRAFVKPYATMRKRAALPGGAETLTPRRRRPNARASASLWRHRSPPSARAEPGTRQKAGHERDRQRQCDARAHATSKPARLVPLSPRRARRRRRAARPRPRGRARRRSLPRRRRARGLRLAATATRSPAPPSASVPVGRRAAGGSPRDPRAQRRKRSRRR